jgi:hypothetical protein
VLGLVCAGATNRQIAVLIAGSVSDEEARQRYPQGWKAPRPYIRIVPQPG